jgi:hypothetical protein
MSVLSRRPYRPAFRGQPPTPALGRKPTGTGLGPEASMELLALVDAYVSGNALQTPESLQRAAMAQANPQAVRAAIEYGLTQLRTGQFPHTESLASGWNPDAGPDQSAGPPLDPKRLDEQFERGLQAVLDGAAARMGIPG